MAVISVIVPVYRVEKYLSRCIDSVLAQTFRDLEIILVDDGSPDRCGEICDQYAGTDSRIRVLHQENGGLSSARNAGITLATGRYLGFVDSDDYIAEDMYETLYRQITEHDADMAVCGAMLCFSDHMEPSHNISYKGLVDAQAGYGMILLGDVTRAYVYNKLFRAELFREVRFPVGKTFEDIYILGDLMLQARRVYIDNEPKYFYVQRSGSIINSSFRQSDTCLIEAYQRNRDIIYTHFPALKTAADCRVWHSYRYVFQKIAALEKKLRAAHRAYAWQLVRSLRHDWAAILGSSPLHHKERLQLLMIAFLPRLYAMFVRQRQPKLLKSS